MDVGNPQSSRMIVIFDARAARRAASSGGAFAATGTANIAAPSIPNQIRITCPSQSRPGLLWKLGDADATEPPAKRLCRMQASFPERWWTVQRGPGPVLATAIHDGHELRPEVDAAMALSDEDRLREEDPFTGQAILDVPTHIIAHRSRFEFDLNRGAEEAIYRTPEQSWGLKVWQGECDEAIVRRLARPPRRLLPDARRLAGRDLGEARRFVLIDVHSYNHRREGPRRVALAQADAPDINIGTFSMPREQWAFLLDP